MIYIYVFRWLPIFRGQIFMLGPVIYILREVQFLGFVSQRKAETDAERIIRGGKRMENNILHDIRLAGKPLRDIMKRIEKKNDIDRRLGSWLFSLDPPRTRPASCRLQSWNSSSTRPNYKTKSMMLKSSGSTSNATSCTQKASPLIRVGKMRGCRISRSIISNRCATQLVRISIGCTSQTTRSKDQGNWRNSTERG